MVGGCNNSRQADDQDSGHSKRLLDSSDPCVQTLSPESSAVCKTNARVLFLSLLFLLILLPMHVHALDCSTCEESCWLGKMLSGCDAATALTCGSCLSAGHCIGTCSIASCSATCEVDSDCSADGIYCNGNLREGRDYFCGITTNTCPCNYTVTGTIDCSTTTTDDTDGSATAYTVAGYIHDYSGCSAGECTYTRYNDTCSGTSLTEYGASGSGYTTNVKQCTDYEGRTCTSNNVYWQEWGCSGTPGYCNDAAVTDTLYDNCGTKSSADTDSNSTDYTHQGTVTDYGNCASGWCSSTNYTDSCSGVVLTEYGASGSSYTSGTKNCSDYNLLSCVGANATQTLWGCASGICSNSAMADVVENCSTKISTDTDGAGDAYNDSGVVTDYTGCTGGACVGNTYNDSCSDSYTLVEYGANGLSYNSTTKNCSEYNGGRTTCSADGINSMWVKWGCGGTPANCSDAWAADTTRAICTQKATTETDGGANYTVAGSVSDFTLCGAAGTCTVFDSFNDTCSVGTNLTEYVANGVSYYSAEYNCSGFNTYGCNADNRTLTLWGCSGSPGYCNDAAASDSVENCSTKASIDTDGGVDWNVSGIVTDYTGCSGGECSQSNYSDTCINSSWITEYSASGTTYSSTNFNCSSMRYRTCNGDTSIWKEWGCSGTPASCNDAAATDTTINNCSTASSTDSDGSATNYTGPGVVTDIVSCGGAGSCAIRDTYNDTCSGTVLTEYAASSATYTSSTKECQDYEATNCTGTSVYWHEWGCTGTVGYCTDAAVGDSLLYDCASRGANDTDGSNNAYTTAGKCINYTGTCSGSDCVTSGTYLDYCSGESIYERYASGNSCLTNTIYDCNNVNYYSGGTNNVTAACGSTDNDGTEFYNNYGCQGSTDGTTGTDANCYVASQNSLDCDTQDAWVGGGNTAGCGNDSNAVWWDFYATSGACSHTTNCTGTGYLDPETYCAADSCSNACNGTSLYSYKDYYFDTNTTTCNYALGSLVSSCDDSNNCTTNGCSGSACSYTPVTNGTACQDGGNCQGGVCVQSQYRQPTYTNFTGETTDFSQVSGVALESLSDVKLEYVGRGKIAWISPINVSGADFDYHVRIGPNQIYVNSSGLSSSANSAANLTIYNSPYANPIPFRDNARCWACSRISISGKNLTFSVPGFSNYTTVENTSLMVWSNNESNASLYHGSIEKYVNDTMEFFANYTNQTSAVPISDAACTIYFSTNWAAGYSMGYNSSISAYYYGAVFTTNGSYSYNISCSRLGYAPLALADSFSLNAKPDFLLNSSSLVFSSNTPFETQNITITATIYNVGGTDASGVLQFFHGAQIPGNQIDVNKTLYIPAGGSNTSVVSYIMTPMGEHNFSIVFDPPVGSGGLVSEILESNNVWSANVSVVSYQIVVGNVTGQFVLETGDGFTLINWSATNTSGTNIYFADADSSINFAALKPLSRTIAGSYASDDFEDADTLMNLSSLSDSLNSSYTLNRVPIATQTFISFGNNLTNVPIINSTNSSMFFTGILWDSSDDIGGDGGYDLADAEDILFITRSTDVTLGIYGRYAYEIKIPAKLREYKTVTTDVVNIYAELK